MNNPANITPLLEIIRTDKTSPQVILDLLTVGKIIKKVPIVVRNCTGFAVNRTFFPYMQAPQLLVHLGVDLFRVDRAIRNFGFPLGPFRLQDLGGYRIENATLKQYEIAYPDRIFTSPLTDLMLKDGRNVTDKEITEMVLFPTINEAYRVLDEGVIARASDLDVASVLGMSFPSYRGGIMFCADTVGPTIEIFGRKCHERLTTKYCSGSNTIFEIKRKVRFRFAEQWQKPFYLRLFVPYVVVKLSSSTRGRNLYNHCCVPRRGKKNWLWKLKDACYDIKYILEEFETTITTT
ncbi:Peroxisomal fatty acid beta-oxidation multifunctional protein AIM1 [Hibiscus syriacus]|uniref:Peroxisomal fatty acid beta-oxidation multifunctional protein AIM1 n=1 Tax=Hibiscus syriacus TaxID=106335 RepID=A0A6A2YTL6_HIBSY|nr:Peroxisomal fatty acid beta-oxidation multifunctional protein AIM1 [Hibiscus syriacus]